VARHAQVDQARRAVHDQVARLHIEVHHVLGREVVQHRAGVQREGQHLLDDQPVATDERRQTRPVDVLEQHVRPLAFRIRAERPHQQRVREPGEQRGLRRERFARGRVARLMRAKQLGHDHRAPPLVPRQPRLVAVAAAQQRERRDAGCHPIALGEVPRIHAGTLRQADEAPLSGP
jgi:hypothetical protein